MILNGQCSSKRDPPRSANKVLDLNPHSQLKKLRLDQQIRNVYLQHPGNRAKGLVPRRLFTLFQSHQCHPADTRLTGKRILGQTGGVAQSPNALAERMPSRAWPWPQQPGDRTRHSSDGRSPRES